MIAEPGIYTVPEAEYHADKGLAPTLGRSLSVTGAKKLLESPARFHHQREHGQPHKAAFDFGHVAHELLLGEGQGIVVLGFENWRKKEANEAADKARADGKVPILAADYEKAVDMATAVDEHPVASAILSTGKAEQSLYWVDDATGVTRRGRMDWLRDNAIVDYKTTTAGGADPETFGKTAANFGYHMQDAWYTDGAAAVGLGDLPFLFIVQEKEPPYLVSVVQLDDEARDIGRDLNNRALAMYAECESTGVWPGYPSEIASVSLPFWYTRQHQGVVR